MWLEFDLDGDAAGSVRAPGIGVCVERDYERRHRGPELVYKSDNLEAGRFVLDCLVASNGALRTQWAEWLSSIHSAIPERGNLINVMPFSSRNPAVLKLYVSVPRLGVRKFLDDIGWEGDAPQLERLLHRFDEQRVVYLDLSVEDRLRRRLGFGFSQFHLAEQRDSDPTWTETLRTWVKLGLLQQDLAARLRRWSGIESGVVGSTPTWTTRWLDLKLVITEDGRLVGKAYLGFRTEPLPPIAAALIDHA